MQRKYSFDRDIGIVYISSVKILFPTSVIWKNDLGDEHKFFTILMEKAVGRIGIINNDLFSDQFFFSVGQEKNV